MKKDFLYKWLELVYKKRKATGAATEKNRLVYRNIKQLYPSDTENHVKDYYVTKAWQSIVIAGVGLLIGVILLVLRMTSGILSGNQIKRPDAGELTVPLVVETEDECIEVEVSVAQRRLSVRELEELYSLAIPSLETIIKKNNVSLSEIRENMEFPNEIKGFPFSLTWQSGNCNLVMNDGSVQNGDLWDESVEVNIMVSFQYMEFERTHTFSITVRPPVRSWQESIRYKILKEIEESDRRDKEKEVLVLPETIGGNALYWKEKESYDAIIIIFLAVLLAGAVYYIKDYDLQKKVTQKEQELEKVFPELVSKMAVYLGAGMTLRGVWELIAEEYHNRVRTERHENDGIYFLAAEMQITFQEMKSGISEAEAYERFGKRCQSTVYIKFAALLIQNLKKGSTNLSELLLTESRIAFEQRKNKARKYGEEAGTKMLFPMMLLMGIVMVMLMVPAFINFN